MDLSTFFVLNSLVQFILPQNSEKVKKLETCLLHLVENYQDQHVLIMADSKSYELEFLLNVVQSRWYMYRRHNQVFKIPLTQIAMVLLLYQNTTALWGAFDTIGSFFFESHVVLIVFDLQGTRYDVEKELYELWKYNFRNALVVQRRDLKVYGYSPILSGYCTNVEVRSLGDCENLEYQIYDTNVDMSNCTIRIGANPLMPYFNGSNGGYEASILGIVTEKLGLQVEYTVSHMGILVPMLERLKLDLLVGAMVPSEGLSNLVAYYGENELALFVPVAKALPPWRNLVQIYDLPTWIGLLASVVAITLFWYVAPHNNHTSIFYIVCSIISSLPHTPTTYKPLIALWLLFTIILANAFTGLLVSFMFKPLHDQQMSSLDDLIVENWRIFDSTLYPLFINYTNLELLDGRHQYCYGNATDCFYQLSNDKIAYASTIRNFNYMSKLHGHFDVHKFNSLKLYLVFWPCYRSKYKTKIQEVAGRMFEVGLVQYLDTYNFDPPKSVLDKHYKPIALKHLYLIIGLYFVGMFAALFAYFYELRRVV